MNLLKVLKNVRKKPVAPVSTECNSDGQDNPAHGAVHGTRIGEDCDGSHHHLGVPERQDADSGTQASCGVCMGTRMCEMEPFKSLNSWISYGVPYPSFKDFAKLYGCVYNESREPSMAAGTEQEVRLSNSGREQSVQGLVNETIQSAEETFKKLQEKDNLNWNSEPTGTLRLMVSGRYSGSRTKTGDEPNKV
jgi:hypothetical protein